ncbi:MAG: nitroreductase family protein [Deltaproteobacteria bacterium]|nr:nitroreductase family protein [Deltaproteobacteria bacterium]
MLENRQFLDSAKKDAVWGRGITPPQVSIDKCIGCGQCVKDCPALVLELRDKKMQVVYGEGCIACGHCWAVCPEGAVVQQEVETDTSLKPGPGPAVTADALQLLIRERRSVRLFKDKPVSKDQLIRIIDAGRYAPTGSNRQDVNYVVVSNHQKVAELRSLVEGFMENSFKLMQNSAIAFFYGMKFGRSIVYSLRHYAMWYDFLKNKKDKHAYGPLPYGSAVIIAHGQSFDSVAPFNCSVALYNCSLMAHSLGLGACFLGFVQAGANMDKKIKHWLGIPKEHQSYGAMVVGHPDVKYHRLIERREPEIKWI